MKLLISEYTFLYLTCLLMLKVTLKLLFIVGLGRILDFETTRILDIRLIPYVEYPVIRSDIRLFAGFRTIFNI